MDITKEHLMNLLAQFAPNPYLQAIVIILVFIGLAKILDLIVIRFIKGWLEKTTCLG